jgi:hypothetical protein
METGDQDWTQLAMAFFALAHNDREAFDRLEQRLKETDVGRLCAAYLESGERDLIEQAGYLLTGTQQWYIYLGRSM